MRSRLGDLLTLAGVGVVAGLILLPQFLSVTEQEDIIAGHSFLTYLSMRHGLFDAVFQHSRHLNDFPYQYALTALAAVGGFILLVKKVWWPLAVWLLLIVINVDAGTPLWGPLGVVAGAFGEFFYKDPRRIAAATTPLFNLMAAVALVCLVAAVVALAKRFTQQRRPMPARFWAAATAVLLVGDQRGQCGTLLSAASVSVRRQVRLDNGRPAGPRGDGLPGETARRAQHPDRRLQCRRHLLDVRGGGPAPAVDPLRLPRADGPGLPPLQLLGVRQKG